MKRGSVSGFRTGAVEPQVRSIRIGKSILGWAFGALPSGDIQEAQCFLARQLAQPPVVGWRLVLWRLKSNMECERHARCALELFATGGDHRADPQIGTGDQDA